MKILEHYRWRRPQLVPLAFIILATITLLTLGIWQVQRLQWKQGVIAQIEQMRAQPPLDHLPHDAQALSALEFHPARLTGRFDASHVLHLTGSFKGVSGYYLLMPLTLEDGQVVPVSVGFAPQRTELPVFIPSGVQQVTGVLRRPREQRFFAPHNQPEKNIWFYEDMPAMRLAFGLPEATPLAPIVLAVTEKLPAQQSTYPLPHNAEILVRNDHLGYAITWFSLALAGIVMFIVYHLERKLAA